MKRAAIAALWLCLAARPAHASGPEGRIQTDSPAPIIVAVLFLGLVLPCEFGAFIPEHDPGDATDVVIGWSWQIPIPVGVRLAESYESHHRLVGGVDLMGAATGKSDTHLRGRLGYRYSGERLFGGLGGTIDRNGWGWSPELGVRFLPWGGKLDKATPALHLLVRAEIAPRLDAYRGVAALLGWTFF